MMVHLTKAEVGQNWPAKQANVAHSVGLDNMTGNGGMDLNFSIYFQQVSIFWPIKPSLLVCNTQS